MTYTITTTDPGAEPVTVALEWTTEVPTQPGWYWVVTQDLVSLALVDIGLFVHINGTYYTMTTSGLISRWLGPLPEPAK